MDIINIYMLQMDTHVLIVVWVLQAGTMDKYSAP